MPNVSLHIRNMLLLFLVSLILLGGLFYADEGAYSFDYLFNIRTLVSLIGFATFFSIFPIGIYNLVAESKYKKLAIVAAIVGYIPLVTYVCLPLIF